MKLIRIALCVWCTLLISGINAQTTHEWKEASAAGYPYKYVSNDPMEARFYTLKNGLTVILSPNKKDPRMQVYIAVKAGSKTDPADHTGLAHYLEHMMFKGTTHYGTLDWSKEKPLLDQIDGLYEEYNHTLDEAQRKAIYHRIDSVSGLAAKWAIANEYDKLMTSMGAQGTNAFTSNERTVYTEDVPANAAEKFFKVQADRFSNPVFRIFHTELEAVYEEKNRGLDNDGRKANEMLMANLFLNHNYGKQTTIGTIEHLKNPSLIEIKKYFKTYYVPNNMGIIVSGDFDPDVLIKVIDTDFGSMPPGPVPKYTFEPEAPIASPIVKEVLGPDAEFVTLGYRLPGVHSPDVLLADLVGDVLNNGKAGLIDINLIKKQKLLRADAGASIMVDYSDFELQGTPTMGQSLDDVRNLLLGEIDNLKKGNFDNDLLVSIVNNNKKAVMMRAEKYGSRARTLMNLFTTEQDWLEEVSYIDKLSKLTKKDIVDFANKYFSDNYVAVYKRKGEDKTVIKVQKPPITPVETNRDKQSPFVKEIMAMPVAPIKPVWVNYATDVEKGKAGPAEVLYVHNNENGLFQLSYRIDKIGAWGNKKINTAAQYLTFLGTDKMTAEDFTKEFYKMACNFSVMPGNEYTTITIDGLQENYDKAVALFDDLLTHCKVDDNAWSALKSRITKSRSDSKNNKGMIMNGLVMYARFGPSNPFNNVLTQAELNSLTGAELVDLLHSLPTYKHRILYYGPASLKEVSRTLVTLHKMPAVFAGAPVSKTFSFSTQTENNVLFADYNMVQSEIRWVRNIPGYDPTKQPAIDMFNNYFGGGMGSLVFQTIRESKALAYSTNSFVQTPEKKEDPYYISAYVGCQADKFNESVIAMNQLLNELPSVESNFSNARSSLKKDIETQRIYGMSVITNYLVSERRGLKDDIRKLIYENCDKLTYADLKKFHDTNMAGKPFTYCILASEKKISIGDMQKIGKVQKLTLEEIFGY